MTLGYLYAYLQKHKELDIYNLYVVLPNDQNFKVDFSSPPYGPGDGEFYTNINIYVERDSKVQPTAFPAHKYQISKISASDFYNDTVISIWVKERINGTTIKHREYLYAYEDADLVSNLDGDIAYYSPHILLLKPTGEDIRMPRVLVPVKKSDTLLDTPLTSKNNLQSHSADVTITKSDDLKWEDCISLKGKDYSPIKDGHFESEITNTNTGGKKKFKVKDKHYVQQPGVILEKVIEALRVHYSQRALKSDFGRVLDTILGDLGLKI